MAQIACTKCGQLFDDQEQSNWGDFTCFWHPREPISIGNTGMQGDYAELWYFPCCGKGMVGLISDDGFDIKPSRVPGCQGGFHAGSRPRIFMSYARADAGFARFLENELIRRGYSVWKDQTELLPGTDWQKSIDEAVQASTHFVIVLSPRSVERPEVNRELTVAFKAGKPVIPILLESCDGPAQLRKIDYIDWREGQDHGSSPNFGRLDEAFGDPVRLKLLEQFHKGRLAN